MMDMTKGDSRWTSHKAWVLVADGRKALIARNIGTALAPRLDVHATLTAPDNPATREQATDRPGRFRKDAMRRIAADLTDLHALAEVTFLRDAATQFARLLDEEPDATAVVVAPPVALATLRGALARHAERIETELAKDFTKHPLADIERALAAE
jgi:protein required for attachment to host cells